MRSTVLARLVFSIVLLFALIGVVESGFIVYDAFSGSLSVFRAPDLGRGVRSWTVHHAMRPGYRDGSVRLNSFGLRSPEVAVPKPDGTFRVLLLGDSFTFGFMAREEEVFARLLETRLRQQDTSRTIEVVNAGVLSYCPLLEYLQYRHHLHALDPDLVVLNFDMSDVQDHIEYTASTVRSDGGVPLFVTEPSLARQRPSAFPGLLSFEWVARKLRAVKTRFEAATDDARSLRDLDRYVWTFDEGPAMEGEAREAMAPIADLQRLLAHDGIPLVVATYPQPWQVSGDATPDAGIRGQFGIALGAVHVNDRPFQMLARFTSSIGVPFVDATPAFRAQPDAAGLYLADDFHFSPRGNALYAEVLASYLAGLTFQER